MDYGIYTMNHRAEDFVREMAPELSMRFTLPVELNSRELEARDSRERELLVYGSIPVMVTAQCIRKTVEGSGSAGSQKEGISGKEPVPFLLQYDLQFQPPVAFEG